MRRHLPIIALILSAIFWGLALPAFKLAQHIPPLSYATIRFGSAFVILALYYWLSNKYQPIQKQHTIKLLFTGITGVSLNISLLFIGLRLTEATMAAVITNLAPVAMIFAAALFLAEPLTKRHVLGAIIACLGTLVIVGTPLLHVTNGDGKSFLGNILIVVSTLSWVAFSVLSKELTKVYSTLTITVWAFLIGLLSFIPFAFFEYLHQPTWIYHLTTIDVVSVVYYSLFGTIAAYCLYQYGLAKASADFAAMSQYITPIVSIAFAILFLGERLTIPFGVGALFVFAGVLIASTNLSLRGTKQSHSLEWTTQP